MHREHRLWRSPNLGWEMGVAIFGHFGPPLLFFPTSLGDEWEHEGQGMIRTLSPLIEAGRMKVFCVRSVTAEGLFNRDAHPFHRSWVLRCYDSYIRQEVIPFIHHHCQGLPPIAVMGASLGAFHAANTLFKHPDAVKRCFGLSGVYDMRRSMDGMYDDNFYFNNPVDYLPNLSDPWTFDNLATCDIHIATGRGPFEDRGPSDQLAAVLRSKGIRHSFDDWEDQGGHDWPFWHHQMWTYCSRLYECSRAAGGQEPVSEISIVPVTAPLNEAWTAMTFPSYRQALALVGTPHTDSEGSRMIACAAIEDGLPAGLGLAQVPKDPSQPAEILSLFVRADLRGRGIATGLVEGLEAAARDTGRDTIMGVYMTGKPSIPIVERVFEKRGFEPPVLRKAAVRITPEQAVNCPWWGRGRLPEGGEMFMWTELTAAERAHMQKTNAEAPWIDPLLEPWICDARADPISSVGMRVNGEVLGWVINHRAPPNFVVFTTAFVRKDFQRIGALFKLLVHSIVNIQNQGLCITFVTSSMYPRMLPFTLTRIGPYGDFCGETRGVSKKLTVAATA